ncbi:potassium channel family protein [Phycicoccus ginsengisoli]
MGATRTPGALSDASPVQDGRVEDWERRTGPVLIGAAVVFLGAYAWPILDPKLPGWAAVACTAVTWLVWVLFLLDLVLRVSWSQRRAAFLWRNWVDVVTLAVPMLRPLRVLRVVVALSVITRRGQPFARGRVVASVAASVAVVALVASLAVLDAERGAKGATITSFGDATWWAATTVTTVGYGDRYPVTAQGRLVAVALMVTGIALLGVVTAAIASWFVEKVGEVQAAEDRTAVQVAELAEQVAQLRMQLTEGTERGA